MFVSTLRVRVIMWGFGDGTYETPNKQSDECQHEMGQKKGKVPKA